MGTLEQLVELKPEEIAILKTYKRTGGGYGCVTFLAIVLAVNFFSAQDGAALLLAHGRQALRETFPEE